MDTVCGIPDSRVEIVMLKPPDDGTCLKLASFVRPESVPGSPAAMTDELGLRNVSFEVNDLQAAVDWAASQGYGLVGGMGESERQWQLPHLKWRARRLTLTKDAANALSAPSLAGAFVGDACLVPATTTEDDD